MLRFLVAAVLSVVWAAVVWAAVVVVSGCALAIATGAGSTAIVRESRQVDLDSVVAVPAPAPAGSAVLR